jgi:hypothetical protein
MMEGSWLKEKLGKAGYFMAARTILNVSFLPGRNHFLNLVQAVVVYW